MRYYCMYWSVKVMLKLKPTLKIEVKIHKLASIWRNLASTLRISFTLQKITYLAYFFLNRCPHVFVIFLPKKGFHIALLSHLFNFPYRYVKFFFQLQTPLISAMTHVFSGFGIFMKKSRESYRMESNLFLVDPRLATLLFLRFWYEYL